MNKKEWYENRILWKAKKSFMLEHGYELFENVSLERQQVIRDMFGDTQDVLLALWGNENRFTLISSEELLFNCDEMETNIRLDDIEIIETEAWNEEKSKPQTEYIFVNGHKVWTDKGHTLFSFLNMLQMFPLNVP